MLSSYCYRVHHTRTKRYNNTTPASIRLISISMANPIPPGFFVFALRFVGIDINIFVFVGVVLIIKRRGRRRDVADIPLPVVGG